MVRIDNITCFFASFEARKTKKALKVQKSMFLPPLCSKEEKKQSDCSLLELQLHAKACGRLFLLEMPPFAAFCAFFAILILIYIDF